MSWKSDGLGYQPNEHEHHLNDNMGIPGPAMREALHSLTKKGRAKEEKLKEERMRKQNEYVGLTKKNVDTANKEGDGKTVESETKPTENTLKTEDEKNGTVHKTETKTKTDGEKVEEKVIIKTFTSSSFSMLTTLQKVETIKPRDEPEKKVEEKKIVDSEKKVEEKKVIHDGETVAEDKRVEPVDNKLAAAAAPVRSEDIGKTDLPAAQAEPQPIVIQRSAVAPSTREHVSWSVDQHMQSNNNHSQIYNGTQTLNAVPFQTPIVSNIVIPPTY
ncbi:hypothetical protein PROFUN_02814 [Planoprotostelium fungivorum]|uniref:Uncharacterized protein n=1 Tax=Planoprotostelium fungivorum TaxID=1890364 RepID=A0A2P6NXT1_9EUKA|nr:hypothetical protein PROFUN_02814 [Planoprotostelium fungivorum]